VTPLLQFDLSKAFWVQNMLSNFCYYRWKDVYPIVRIKIDSIHRDFLQQVATMDERALKIYQNQGKQEAVKAVTSFSESAGIELHRVWMDFYGELFVRFRDFYTIVKKNDEPVCGCEAKEPGMTDVVKERIIRETGNHYRVAEETAVPVLHGESKHAKEQGHTVLTQESTITPLLVSS
jgi:hypothetical protein